MAATDKVFRQKLVARVPKLLDERCQEKGEHIFTGRATVNPGAHAPTIVMEYHACCNRWERKWEEHTE